MIKRLASLTAVLLCALSSQLSAQPATNPAGQFGGAGAQPGYAVPYRAVTAQQITEVLSRIHDYLDANTPARLIDATTNQPITDFSKPNPNATVARGLFQLISYEWGVTYSGMLRASDATGDAKYKDYVAKRLQFIADVLPMYRTQATTMPGFGPGVVPSGGAAAAAQDGAARGGAGRGRGGFGRGGRGGAAGFVRPLVNPQSLDDSGSICAAFIKAHLAGVGPDLMPQIETDMNFISTKQFRLQDGTLARVRPVANSLWLDDLYMSVPALSQMGKMTGDKKYYDDACKQILQFASRMWVPDKGIWMHGWTTNTDDHPEFYWARANGWAIMAMTELLDVLPEDHPQRAEIMKLYKAHVKGLSKLQSSTGLWHQLLDRNDSYLETSATAIYVYCMARGINRGWISPVTYGPIVELGWNGLTTKVTEKGEVEGTCVGTDMAFDVAYYYARPTSVTAAHGYGPVLLAGSEIIELLKTHTFRSAGGGLMYIAPAGNQ